jgi:fatty-acyl-CoA synthase
VTADANAPLLGISIDELTPIASITDVERLEATPIDERLTIVSTYALIERAAMMRPDAVAFGFLPLGLASDVAVRMTNRALFAAVTQAANLFHELGVNAGEGVAILLPVLPQSYVAMWGASAAGVAVPINPLLSQAHLAEIMRAANVRVIVTIGPEEDATLWAKVEGLPELLPELETILIVGNVPTGARDFSAELSRQPEQHLVSGRLPGLDDIASCFHTGGTTAAPKLVSHTHRQQLVTAVQSLLGSDLRAGDVLLSALPTFHVIAGIASGLAALTAGAQMLLPGVNGYRNPYLLMDFWKIVARHKVTSFSAVPTVLGALLDVPVDADISSLRYVPCGAAPLPVALIRAFEAKADVAIIEAYGMTEATTMVATNPRGGERRPGSVGFRVPYLEMRIALLGADGAHQRDCGIDEEGDVFLRGPNVVGHYLGDSNTPSPLIAGWLATGDLGRIDAQGYLWLSGRSKDLIIRSGHNIDPRLIEEVLHTHPAIAAAAAVGKPDAYAGEVPMAFVTLRPDQSATAAELLAFARENVSERPAAPAEIIILDAMPLTPLGKIFKPALRDLAKARADTNDIGEKGA